MCDKIGTNGRSPSPVPLSPIFVVDIVRHPTAQHTNPFNSALLGHPICARGIYFCFL